MKKPYLLIAGQNFYPKRGTYDWKERFESYETAKNSIVEFKGHGGLTYYFYKGVTFDWFEIVDLRVT